MSNNKITKGVMKVFDYGNSVMYRASCSCGDPDHDLWISIQKDDEFEDVSLSFYVNVNHDVDYPDIGELFHRRFIVGCRNFWERFKNATKLLFTGYLKYESEFIIDNPEQMGNIVRALKEGKQILQSYERNKKNHKYTCKDKLSKDNNSKIGSNISAFPKDSVMNEILNKDK